MKKVMMLVIGLLLTGTISAHASTTEVTMTTNTSSSELAIPTLYGETNTLFTVEQEGDNFTVTVSENASTGYMWSYQINNEEMVEFVSEVSQAPVNDMLGTPSDKSYTFTILKEGVSTILFENKRSFDHTDIGESFTLLAYMSNGALIVEEDQIVYAMDKATPTLATLNGSASYNGSLIQADVEVQEINGVTMVPLRAVAEAMGYTITWNNATKSVDIQQGPQWTSVIIGQNRYFRNRMAPLTLSSAPLILNDRTLVPLEFFADILGKAITVDQKAINFIDGEAIIHKGYIQSITRDETGTRTITLTSDLTSEDIMLQTIIHTSDAYTFYQKELVEGDWVQVVGSQVMTMSIPGQTSGYVTY